MIQKAESLDIFGRTFSLKTDKGSRSYKTTIGGLFTIFAFLIFAFITYRATSNYRDTTKPVVSVNKIKLDRPPRLDLFANKVISLLGAFDAKFLTKEELKKYLTYRIEMVTTTKDSKGNYVDKAQLFEGDIVENVKNQKVKELARDVISNNNVEIDYFEGFSDVGILANINPEEFWITGSKFKLPYRRFRMKLYPCSLLDPSDCVPIEALSRTQFGNTLYLQIGNFSSKRNPVLTFSDVDNVLYLGLTETVVLSVYLKENFIYDDDMGLIRERLKHTYLDVDKVESKSRTRLSGAIHCTVAQIDAGECEPYLEFIWKSSSQRAVIKRTYITIFDVISEVGGFCDLIRYGILVFYFYYNMSSYTQLIRSQLVDGYLELITMKRQERQGRISNTKNQIRDKVVCHGPNKQKLNVIWRSLKSDKVLNTNIDFLTLLRLSFKSKMVVKLFLRDPFFEALAPTVILKEKILQINQIRKMNKKHSYLCSQGRESEQKKPGKANEKPRKTTNQDSTEKVVVQVNDSLRKKILFDNNLTRKKQVGNQKKEAQDNKFKEGGALITIDESTETPRRKQNQKEKHRSATRNRRKKVKQKINEGCFSGRIKIYKSNKKLEKNSNSKNKNISHAGKRFTPMGLKRLSQRRIRKRPKPKITIRRI